MQTSRKTRIFIFTVFSLIGLCLLVTAGSAISNIGLPKASPVLETLSMADKIRLAEAQHLIRDAGNQVWAGWGEADIPVILYNEAYAFLLGYPDPPSGWFKVPTRTQRGSKWEITPGDTYYDQQYYRQQLADPRITPEAFTVLVGERWVSSITTYDWIKISLVQPIRQDLPGFLRPIFPYRLLIQGLLGGSDKYISLIAHEIFHSYQGMTAPDKLAESESTNTKSADHYPWGDSGLKADWQKELDLLAEALQTNSQKETINLAQQFLTVRAGRRNSANLSQELVAYEQQREWLEGLARYAELEIWRQASADSYLPLPETAQLPDFDSYADFKSRWSQELSQMRRMANDEGDGRFYYSGMAQAFLLDRLALDWKMRALNEGVWLEDLLAEAAP